MMMDSLNISTVDLIIVGAYLVLCLAIGLMKFDKIKTLRDYTLGVKPFSTTVLFATTFATTVGISRTIGIVEKSYLLGAVFILPLLVESVSWFFMSKLLARNLDFFKQQKFLTLSDIMEYWYGKQARWITNLCSVFFALGITSASIISIGYLCKHFLGMSEVHGALIAVVVITLYSALGGIQAVAFTDLFQLLIFFVALPLACAIGIKDAGGISNILRSLPESHLTIDSSNILLFLSFIFYAIVPVTGIPYIQRALIAKNKEQLIRTYQITGVVLVLFLLCMSLMGLIIYNIDPNIKPATALYYFISNHLSAGVVGLMISGLFAVIMSTQDSYLNAASTVISRDVFKQIWPDLTDKYQLLIARVSCFVMAGVAVVIAFTKDSILEIFWLINNFWDPLITIPLLGGLLGARISRKSFMVLALSSIAAVSITQFITGEFDTRSYCIGGLTSIAILYFANMRYKKQKLAFGEPSNGHHAQNKLLYKIKEELFNSELNVASVYMFSAIMLVSYIASLFVVYSQNDLSTGFRVLSAVSCVFLLFNEVWGSDGKNLLPGFWHLTLCLCLPFTSTYLMFASNYDVSLIANCVLSIGFLYLLVNPRIFLLLGVVGVAGSYATFIGQDIQVIGYFNDADYGVFSCFLVITAAILHLYNEKFITKKVHEDVSRLLESKVNERTASLKQALNVKDEFLRKVSHEIRTPLHGIIGFSQELSKDWDKYSTEEIHKYVNIIAESSDRLMEYTQNILDIASYKTGKLRVMFEKNIDICAVASKAIADAEALISSKGKHLEIFLETDALQNFKVEVDRLRILQVFNNLLSNAVQYSNEGKIIVRLENDDKLLKVSVIDEGVGVPEDEWSSIFVAFTQSTRTKSPAKGTGLGLAICDEIIRAHQGKIWVEANENGGSKFIFVIPYEHEHSIGKKVKNKVLEGV